MLKSKLGDLVRRARKERGITRRMLVERLGYKNLNKGLRRLDELEKHGRCQPEFLNGVIDVIGLDAAEVRHAFELDRAEENLEVLALEAMPFPPVLIVRWFAGFYCEVPLPREAVENLVLANEHARNFANRNRVMVALVTSPTRARWFDDSGKLMGEAAPPATKVRGRSVDLPCTANDPKSLS